jgi:hypothetical protein
VIQKKKGEIIEITSEKKCPQDELNHKLQPTKFETIKTNIGQVIHRGKEIELVNKIDKDEGSAKSSQRLKEYQVTATLML